jgi:hypothetical protein
LFISLICNSKSIWNLNFSPKGKLLLFNYSTTLQKLVNFGVRGWWFCQFTKSSWERKKSSLNWIGLGPSVGARPALTPHAWAPLSPSDYAELHATAPCTAVTSSARRHSLAWLLSDRCQALAIKVVDPMLSPLSPSLLSPTVIAKTEHPHCRSIHRWASFRCVSSRARPAIAAPAPCAPLWLGIGARGWPPTTRVVFPPPPQSDAGESWAWVCWLLFPQFQTVSHLQWIHFRLWTYSKPPPTIRRPLTAMNTCQHRWDFWLPVETPSALPSPSVSV